MAAPAHHEEKQTPKIRRCPYCAEEIHADAKKCKHCGEFLDAELSRDRAMRKWSPGVAALLSLIIPGAGQMYKGKILESIIWLLIVVGFYALLFVPGLVLHILCIASACSGDPTKDGKTQGF